MTGGHFECQSGQQKNEKQNIISPVHIYLHNELQSYEAISANQLEVPWYDAIDKNTRFPVIWYYIYDAMS